MMGEEEDDPLQSDTQFITKIAPPTGQSAEQFSYTIRVIFCTLFVTAYPTTVKFVALITLVVYLAGTPMGFHKHCWVSITLTHITQMPMDLQSRTKKTKTPPDFQEQEVVHVTLVYPTKPPPDFHKQGVVHITLVYPTTPPPEIPECALGALVWVSGDLRVRFGCSGVGFG